MYNAGVLGPKGLAKKLAKDTGKVAVGVPENVIKGKVRLEPSTEPPLMPPADKAISNVSLVPSEQPNLKVGKTTPKLDDNINNGNKSNESNSNKRRKDPN